MDKEAFMIKVGGVSYPIQPKNGTDFQLKELYGLLGCELIEIITLDNDFIAIVDEEGRLMQKPFNPDASELIGGIVVGDVIVCKSKYVK